MGSNILFHGTTQRALDVVVDKYYGKYQFCENWEVKKFPNSNWSFSAGKEILEACSQAGVARSLPVLLVSSSMVLSSYVDNSSRHYEKCRHVQRIIPADKYFSLVVPLKKEFDISVQGYGNSNIGMIHNNVDYTQFSKDLERLLAEQKLFSRPKKFDSSKDLVWHYSL